VADFSVDPRTRAGDGFAYAGVARRAEEEKQARLEERYRHELMDDEERQELRDEIRRRRADA
jgi:hypothetical protein